MKIALGGKALNSDTTLLRIKNHENLQLHQYNKYKWKGSEAMDWTTGIQRAIDYIEDNLTEKLDYEEIAKRAFVSNFHFQRIFGILCGYTLGEYIRNRHLTLAGSDLASSDVKVIDTALKFGYDSPESFGRAFTKFHGIAPSQARTMGANLKSFSRLSVKLILEGGNIMDYRIEKKDTFKVIVRKERFSSDNEVNKKEIPEFWDKCRKDGTVHKLCDYMNPKGIFGDAIVGMCFEGSATDKNFVYAIGAAYGNGNVSADLTIEEIPALTWAIFKCTGAMPNAIQELWHKIYSDFFPTSEYQPGGGLDFELYPGGDIHSPDYESEIWISVVKRSI